MGKGLIKALLGGFTALLLIAPSALAATPEDIYKDMADNGRLDGTYTQVELQAFLQSATVQGYGNPLVVVVPTVVTTQTPTTLVAPPATVATPPVSVAAAPAAAPAAGVAGTSKTIVQPKPKAKPQAKLQAKPQPVAQVAGVATPPQAPLARTASAETLPFTGAELAMFALVGSALLLGGILLRVSSRQR